MNFQYRYGMTTMEALKHLYAEGGIRRFYRGVGPALFQGPLSRFGDTASNAGMLALWDSFWQAPNSVKTVTASAAAAGFRVFLMPIDACKTILQVEGADGLTKLGDKIKKGGVGVLWHGSIGAMSATFVGHYPWFFTNNYLNDVLPKYDRKTELPKYLARNALMGFRSSAVSDTRFQLSARDQNHHPDLHRSHRVRRRPENGDRKRWHLGPFVPWTGNENHLQWLPVSVLGAVAPGTGLPGAASATRRRPKASERLVA